MNNLTACGRVCSKELREIQSNGRVLLSFSIGCNSSRGESFYINCLSIKDNLNKYIKEKINYLDMVIINGELVVKKYKNIYQNVLYLDSINLVSKYTYKKEKTLEDAINEKYDSVDLEESGEEVK